LDELCDELLIHLSGEGTIHARYFAITCIGTLALQDRFFSAAFKRVGATRRLRSLAILETDQLLYDLLTSAEHELRRTYSHMSKRALVDPYWDLVGYGTYGDVALGERLSCPYAQDDAACAAFPHGEHFHIDNLWIAKNPTVSSKDGGVLVHHPTDVRWVNSPAREIFNIGKYMPKLSSSSPSTMDHNFVLVSIKALPNTGRSSMTLLVSKKVFEERADMGAAVSIPFSVLVSAW